MRLLVEDDLLPKEAAVLVLIGLVLRLALLFCIILFIWALDVLIFRPVFDLLF